MRTLFIECNMGAAGDMLTAALIELLPERQVFLDRMAGLGLPGAAVEAARAESCGVVGTRVRVTVDGAEEESRDVHEHHHEHRHHHEHHHHHSHETPETGHHHHTSMRDIEELIGGLELPERVRENAAAVYRLIAEAESQVHGKPIDQIHFHEVGSLDALADVVGVCLLMELIGPEKVVVSPVRTGFGQVRCAHGVLPVPAPATAHLLRDIPTYAGSIEGELCTPTGAALLKHFADSFGERPLMRTEAVGCGLGKKEFSQLNCVRAFLGETEEAGAGSGQVAELSCNIDDMTAEEIAFAAEELRNSGALEVFTTAVGMKKGRPGVMLTCLCEPGRRGEMAGLMLRHTTTLGVREHICGRYVLSRREETVETVHGPVRVKVAQGRGLTRRKAEYEDLARIAREKGLTLREARRIAAHARKKD